MAYGDFKDRRTASIDDRRTNDRRTPRRTASDKALRDKAFNIAKNKKRMDINVDLLQRFISFLIKSLPIHKKEQESILM